jgi:hypothetical protein
MVLGLGKQLSKRLYVGYEQAVAGTGGAWQLLYRVARRLTIRAQAEQEGTTLDVIRTWRWDGGQGRRDERTASAPVEDRRLTATGVGPR